jgi:hypothetical protein
VQALACPEVHATLVATIKSFNTASSRFILTASYCVPYRQSTLDAFHQSFHQCGQAGANIAGTSVSISCEFPICLAERKTQASLVKHPQQIYFTVENTSSN